MDLTIREILDLNGRLGVFADLEGLSFAIGYKLQNLATKLEKPVKFFDDKRRSIVDEFAKRDETGQVIVDERGNVVIVEDRVEECRVRFDELFETVISDDFDTFSLKDFENVTIKPSQIPTVMTKYLIRN